MESLYYNRLANIGILRIGDLTFKDNKLLTNHLRELNISPLAVSDISTRPLAQVSVESVGRVQILDRLPAWRVQFSSPRNYLTIKIKNVFTLHFGTRIPKHKLTISILQSFVFQKASNVLHSAKQYGFPLVVIT